MTPPMTVTFHQPCQRLSMNDRHHWAVKARLTKGWRNITRWAAHNQLGHTPTERRRPPCLVRVHFPVIDPGRRRDPHNQAPTVKAIIDGLVDAGVWPDDNDDYVIVLDPKFYKNHDSEVIVELSPRGTTL